MSSRRARTLASAVLAMLLAGCGGGGFSTLPSTGPNNAAAAAGRATMTLTVKVARGAAAAPPERSIAIAIDGNRQTVVRDVTPSATGCTAAPAALICTLGFALDPGPHAFDLTAYDRALDGTGAPQGRVVSRDAGIPFIVAPGAINEVKVALRAVPAAIALIPAPDQDVQGTQQAGFDLYGFYKADGVTKFDRTFTALATDADGDYVLGAAAPRITLASSDPGVLSNGVADPAAPSTFRIAALSYDAAVQPWFTVTATPSAASSGAAIKQMVQLRIAARNAPRIYVMDHLTNNAGKIWVFDEQGDRIAVPGTFAGLDGGMGIGYDKRLNRLYATNEYSSTITVYDPDGNSVAAGGAFPNLYFPLGLAVDNAHGRIYAGNFNGGTANNGGSAAGHGLTVYDESGNQLAVPGAWFEREGVVPYLPYGVFADENDGFVYVADAGYNRAEAFDANGTALFSWPTGEGAAGITQDAASKSLYVTDDYLGVNVFDRHGNALSACRGGTCSGGASGGAAWHQRGFSDANHSAVHGPIGIRRNPGNGWFYVTNYASNSVTAFDAGGNPMTLRGSNLNGGPFGYNGASGAVQGPIGIEVVP